MRPQHHRWFLAAALLVALPCAAVPPATEAFLPPPDKVEFKRNAVVLTDELFLSERTPRVHLLACSEAGATERRAKFWLRERATGRIKALTDLPPADRAVFTERLAAARSLSPFGAFRGIPTARFRFHPPLLEDASGTEWEVARYTIEIDLGAPPTAPLSADSALEASAYSDLLGHVILNADRARSYRTAAQAPAKRWTPEAADGFDGAWLKLAVAADDLYRIDAEWIRAAGLDPASLKPAELELRSHGKPLPLIVRGPADATFAAGASLVFLGERNDSRETMLSTYYLGRGTGPATVMEQRRGEMSPVQTRMPLTWTLEQDNEFQTRLGSFLSVRRMAWVWAELTEEAPSVLVFDAPAAIDPAGGNLDIKIDLFCGALPLPQGTMLWLRLNDGERVSIPLNNEGSNAVLQVPTGQLRREGNSLGLMLAHATEGKGPAVYLDRVHLTMDGVIAAKDGRSNPSPASVYTRLPGRVAVAGLDRREALAVEKADDAAPVELVLLPAEGLRTIPTPQGADSQVIIREIDSLTPAPAPVRSRIAEIVSLPQSADVLILHHGLFSEAAALLANDLKAAGQEALIVDVEAIYESHGDGNLSSEAIRDFLAEAVLHWPGRRPHTAILIGDCNGDGQDIARQGVPNFLPVRQLLSEVHSKDDYFASDSFYTWLTPGDEAADILLGRLPATTPEDALAMVRKSIAQRVTLCRGASPRLLAISDAGEFEEGLAEVVAAGIGPGYEVRNLAANEYAWEDNYYLPAARLDGTADSKSSPQFTTAIEESFNSGATMALYYGHGAPNLWGNQRYWFGGGTPNSDILRLQSGASLPFVAAFTCNNAVIDYPLRPWNICIAEDFVRHEDKGALATLMPSGPGYMQHHHSLSSSLLRAWSRAGVRNVALLSELVRLSHQINVRPDDHSRMFILLGNPTSSLPVPLLPLTVAGPHASPRLGELWYDADRRSVRPLVTGELSASVRLEMELYDARGGRLWSGYTSIFPDRYTSRAVKTPRPPKPATPGIHTLRLTLSGDELRDMRTLSFASPRRFQGEGHALGSLTVLPPGPGSATAKLAVDYVRAGMGSAPRSFVLEMDGAAVGTAAASGTIEEGVTRVVHEIPAGLGGLTTRFEFIARDPITGTELDRSAWLLDANVVPDPAFAPEGFRVLTEAPSEGLTIFFEATVENRAGVRSLPVPIALVDGNGEPLPDLALHGAREVPALAPGERRTIRLRWDPVHNRGSHQVRAVIDPDEIMPDINRTNNRARVAVSVRSKWQLKPGTLTTLTGPPMELAAEVGNSGETDARRVTVAFFSRAEQIPANLVGEVLLDRVEAGTTATVRLELPQQFATRDLNPTFTVSLKGSQQRVSSVGDH